ncbi:hypothetical protein CM15mP35_05810 [bacterium]|nr:MAG: hypothetical protein CM15mP35_05810 [bacterium]
MYYFGFEEKNFLFYKNFLKFKLKKLKISTFLNKITGKNIGICKSNTFELKNLHREIKYYGYWQKSEFFFQKEKNFLVKALKKLKEKYKASVVIPAKKGPSGKQILEELITLKGDEALL